MDVKILYRKIFHIKNRCNFKHCCCCCVVAVLLPYDGGTADVTKMLVCFFVPDIVIL